MFMARSLAWCARRSLCPTSRGTQNAPRRRDRLRLGGVAGSLPGGTRRVGSTTPLGHVLGCWSFLPLHDGEPHALAVSERLEAAALDGRVTDEDVLLAVFGRDEAEALLIVEPLD